jgi:methionyl aminopeptidase
MSDSGIVLKTPAEIDTMGRAAAILRKVMALLVERVRPGVSTLDLDRLAHDELKKHQAVPAFLGLYGFPNTLCTSVNEQVVHGIPSPEGLVEGDIVSLDIGLIKDGFYADMARTVAVGKVDEESRRLIEVAEKALTVGIEMLRPGNRLGDVESTIQEYIEGQDFSVVRDYTGHGIGRKLHEDPKVRNFGQRGRGIRLKPGLVLCLEPMVNAGVFQTRTLDDKWTVVTADGKRSAHVEETVAVTEDSPRVLTAMSPE